MQTVTVKYGIESMNKTFEVPVYVRDIKGNASLRAGLGFGDNIRVLMQGQELGDDVLVPHGAVLTIETRANTKAS